MRREWFASVGEEAAVQALWRRAHSLEAERRPVLLATALQRHRNMPVQATPQRSLVRLCV
jgi:hypothetical protein